jgi:hypothetical protein
MLAAVAALPDERARSRNAALRAIEIGLVRQLAER